MTLIRVINPNTARAMTEIIGRCARAVAAPASQITAVSPGMGPESIESHYDLALAVPGLLAEIVAGERTGAEAYVIACFGDPGLDAARELATGPVIGIAEAAMHSATLVGRSFSVVTTLSRTAGRTWDLAQRYGFADACRGVHAGDVAVLDLLDPAGEARKTVAATCVAALESDRSDVLVLGCAGMADYAAEISADLGVPVIDGVTAAVKLAESLLALGLRTSARDEYAAPGPRPYAGLLAPFTLPG